MTELTVSTVYLLKRAELAVRGCLEAALGEVQVTPSQYFILFLVKTGEATSSAELARSMGVLPQSMVELIAPLERRGAIVRRPDPANNRILRIELTAAGEKLYAKATEVAIRFETELLDDFVPRELARVNRVLQQLIARAEAHVCHPRFRRQTKAETKPRVPRATTSARGRAAARR
jgi:DNA-binding MarR family transcriptional regulator